MSCEDCICWEEADADDLADKIEGLCVERNGKCLRGDACKCKNDDTTEGGW